MKYLDEAEDDIQDHPRDGGHKEGRVLCFPGVWGSMVPRYLPGCVAGAVAGLEAGLGYTVLSGPTGAPGMGKRKARRHG
jgi:hypothetical protein